MQIITDTSLVAGLASTVAASSALGDASPSCSVATTTLTSTVAMTVTVVASELSSGTASALGSSTFTSGCTSSGASSASSASDWTSTGQATPPTSSFWSLTTFTGPKATFTGHTSAGTITVTQCISGNQSAGINTDPGADGTTYIVCAATPFPTMATLHSTIADPLVPTDSTTSFAFFPPGAVNSTVGPTATGSGGMAGPSSTGIVPFTGGAAASLHGKEALIALAAVAIGMLFV